MSTMRCLSCGAETSNGLATCERCSMRASVHLEFLPVYFRNLARWKPGRAGTRQVPGSRVLYDGERTEAGTDAVTRALSEAGNDLATWARALTDDRGIALPETDDEPSQVAALCRLFAEHMTSIGTLEWAGEFIDGIRRHERRLRALTERVAPGWYAGECTRCDVPTHVIPGLTWVTCDGCGATTYARDHLPVILDEARGWVAAPKPMAEAIVALVDGELSVLKLRNRIVQWSKRGHLEAVRATTYDRKRYRLGDVLDRLYAEGPTQLAEQTTAQVG